MAKSEFPFREAVLDAFANAFALDGGRALAEGPARDAAAKAYAEQALPRFEAAHARALELFAAGPGRVRVEKDPKTGKERETSAFGDPKGKAYASARISWADGVLARLIPGGAYDPESKDPYAQHLPIGKADAVYFLDERVIASAVTRDGQALKQIEERGLEYRAFCYLKPPSLEWRARFPGRVKGLEVPRYADILCPRPLAEQAKAQRDRQIGWMFAVELGPDGEASVNPNRYAARFAFFEVEDGVWAGLLL